MNAESILAVLATLPAGANLAIVAVGLGALQAYYDDEGKLVVVV